MKKRLSLLLLFALLGLGQSAFAVDYYWRFYEQPASITTKYADPTSACQAYIAYRKSVNNPDTIWIIKAVTKQTVSVYGCNIDWRTPPSTNFLNATIPMTRVGDTCATGSTYNPNTGLCDVPVNLCQAKTGSFISFRTTSPIPTNATCIGGCAAALNVSNKFTDTKGNTRYYYDGNFTGNQCTGANPANFSTCNLETDCTKETTDPQVDTSNECKPGPDTTTADGRPVTVVNCTDVKETKQDGEEGCKWGTVGAGNEANWTCIVTPPKSTSTKTDTETKTTANPDGSKDTTKTTTTTETKCTGVNSCTTTTTTNVNNNHTNADGSPGNSSSTCVGPKCTSSGNGSGTGQGEGEGEGEEEDGDDDIAGPTKQLLGKASQGFGEAEAEWQTKIDAGRQQLDGLVNQYSALFSGAFDLNMGTGGGGLPCLDTPISALGQNANIKICPADYEDQLVYLKYILLACATILAGFIILRN
ncbi:hypothetical protein ACVW0Y_001792 [Pseudomonas sp. TE3786]